MRPRHPVLPDLWLLSDARNDAVLEAALRAHRRGIALIFRHHHLAPGDRRARFAAASGVARARGHRVILAGAARLAKAWGAHGWYGPPGDLTPRRAGLLALATAHDLREIGAANRLGADAILLSPVFPTRSHPGARTLGASRFRLLAARARVPVIALGGMDRAHARSMRWRRWAGIDGLSTGCRHPEY